MKTNQLTIKGLILKNNVLAAPLAGVSDVGFRSVCHILGASLGYTEMISAKGLHYNNENSVKMLVTSDYEKPCAVQLFGSEAEIIAEACKNPLLEKFDLIDLNMGCPVPKVFNHNEGSALMSDIHNAEKIIKACVKATNKPITVKFRKGIDDNSVNAVEFAKMCEGSGASLVTVHGRLKSQMYSGKSDRMIIARVKNSVKIPVIANGDIYCDADAKSLIDETGADGVMVARGSLGNPQIFSEITDTPSILTIKEAILKHTEILLSFTNENFTCRNMRKHLLWYLNKIKGGKAYKQQAQTVKTMQELYDFVNSVF